MSKKKLSGAATSPKKVEAVVDTPKTLTQLDANLFQQLVQISNQYGKLQQQKNEFETVLNQLKQKRADIASGKIKLPIFMGLGKNKLYQCDNMQDVLADLDAEIRVLSNAVKGIDGQISSHKDAYVEAGLRVSDFVDSLFGKYQPKTPYSKGCSPKKEERVLFEGELEDILKDEEKKEELAKAMEVAKKENSKK